MKKNLALFALAALVAFGGASAAEALTAGSLSPSSVTRPVGSTFNVAVILSPDSTTKDYSAKITVNFDPSSLQVTGFQYGTGELALSQTGYDIVDNTNGVLVKTAGFPGGISSPVTFGTITFRVKASGSTLVSLSNSSQALDANNNNTFVRGGNSLVTVNTSSTPSPTATPQVKGASTKKVTASVVPVVSPQTVVSSQATTTDQVFTASDTASTSGSVLGASVSNTDSGTWIGIGIGVLILLVIIGVVYSLARGV